VLNDSDSDEWTQKDAQERGHSLQFSFLDTVAADTKRRKFGRVQ
jgi:hypothetical protein